MPSRHGHQWSEATPFKQQALRDLLGVCLPTLRRAKSRVLVDANAGLGWLEAQKAKGSPLEFMASMLKAKMPCDLHLVEKRKYTYLYLVKVVHSYMQGSSWEGKFDVPLTHLGDNAAVVPSILSNYSKNVEGLVYLDTNVPDFEFMKSLADRYPKLGLMFTFSAAALVRTAHLHPLRPTTLPECLAGIGRAWFVNPYGLLVPRGKRQQRWSSVIGLRCPKSFYRRLRAVGYIPIQELDAEITKEHRWLGAHPGE